MRFSDPPSAALTFMEGRFSFRIRIKWWVGLLLTDIGKALATRQELFPTTPFRDNDPPTGPSKACFPSARRTRRFRILSTVMTSESLVRTRLCPARSRDFTVGPRPEDQEEFRQVMLSPHPLAAASPPRGSIGSARPIVPRPVQYTARSNPLRDP